MRVFKLSSWAALDAFSAGLDAASAGTARTASASTSAAATSVLVIWGNGTLLLRWPSRRPAPRYRAPDLSRTPNQTAKVRRVAKVSSLGPNCLRFAGPCPAPPPPAPPAPGGPSLPWPGVGWRSDQGLDAEQSPSGTTCTDEVITTCPRKSTPKRALILVSGFWIPSVKPRDPGKPGSLELRVRGGGLRSLPRRRP